MQNSNILEIGTFNTRLTIDYFVVGFRHMSVEDGGELLKNHLKDFIVLPRNKCMDSNHDVWEIAICINFTLTNEYNVNDVFNKIKTISEFNPDVKLFDIPVLDNGRHYMHSLPTLRNSTDKFYTYVLSYTFKDGKYNYYITYGEKLCDALHKLVTKIHNATLEYTFTGFIANRPSKNLGNFGRFKIRDYKVVGKKIILSNGTETINNLGQNEVWMATGANLILLNVLPNYEYPSEVSDNIQGGLDGYDAKQITVIPESMVDEIAVGGFTYKYKNRTYKSKNGMVPGSNDKQLMCRVMEKFIRGGTVTASAEYFSGRTSITDIIKTFHRERLVSEKKSLQSQYHDLTLNILRARREILKLQTTINDIELNSKNKLSIPKIILDKTILNKIKPEAKTESSGVTRSYCRHQDQESLVPTRLLLANENNMPVLKLTKEVFGGED